MSAPAQVLVTGACGFLGRAICRELDAQGYQVHALVRPHSDRSALEGVRFSHVFGDLTDPDSLERAAQQVAEASTSTSPPWLVHNAAALGYRRRDAQLQQAVNVEGTANAFLAARKASFTRALYVSSVVAVGYAEGGASVTEQTGWNAGNFPVEYVQTKREAEEKALAYCSELDVRVVNPGAIFGPGGEKGNTSKLLLALAQGKLGPVVPPGGMSVVGVQDTARGVRLALERGRRGARYILTDEFLCTRDLCERAVARMRSRGIAAEAPRLSVPRFLWPVAIAAVRALERFHEPRLTTSRALRMVGIDWRASSERAREELGWRPTPFDRVLGETLDDLEARGLLVLS
ncbi:MAG TPA: SDR family NAD(P)-dependent oxidoreductase [Planctomycetes bacterium]|nr:SDR family NAD(P)-dependent oxidoreductase [Planctomycetota bacterium]HIK61584.1 SDR family NAD(P)-dependent oxidoreductase [Planctomycetota bacterium]